MVVCMRFFHCPCLVNLILFVHVFTVVWRIMCINKVWNIYYRMLCCSFLLRESFSSSEMLLWKSLHSITALEIVQQSIRVCQITLFTCCSHSVRHMFSDLYNSNTCGPFHVDSTRGAIWIITNAIILCHPLSGLRTSECPGMSGVGTLVINILNPCGL